MSLQLIEEDDNYILQFGGKEVFSRGDKNEILNKWQNHSLGSVRYKGFTEFLTSPHELLKEAPLTDSSKVEIGEWIFRWMHNKKLRPDIEKEYYKLAKSLFSWNLELCPSKYKLIYRARLYLKILFDKENSFSSRLSKDREDEVKDVLFKEPKKARILRDFLQEPNHRTECLHILRRSAEWFLRRYDLATAGDLFKAVNNLSRKSKNTKFTRFQRLKSATIQLTSNRFLITRSIILVAILTAFIFPTFGLDASWLMTIALLCLYSSIIGMMFHFRHDEPWHFRLILPRMLGAIIVGYLPLIMTEEMWKLAYRMNATWQLSLTAILGLSASFMYLFIEINNIAEKHAFQRAFTVWAIGSIETIGVGLILCHLVSKFFSPELLALEDLPINPVKLPVWLPTWGRIDWGKMYSQVLVLFAPLALFIGIFVQILWEDKPISEPL